MALWILKPTDTAAPSWHGNNPESVGSIMVEADSEEEARIAAAASLVVDQKVHDYSVRPDERTTTSPWLDSGASSCMPAEWSAKVDPPIVTVEPGNAP